MQTAKLGRILFAGEASPIHDFVPFSRHGHGGLSVNPRTRPDLLIADRAFPSTIFMIRSLPCPLFPRSGRSSPPLPLLYRIHPVKIARIRSKSSLDTKRQVHGSRSSLRGGKIHHGRTIVKDRHVRGSLGWKCTLHAIKFHAGRVWEVGIGDNGDATTLGGSSNYRGKAGLLARRVVKSR